MLWACVLSHIVPFQKHELSPSSLDSSGPLYVSQGTWHFGSCVVVDVPSLAPTSPPCPLTRPTKVLEGRGWAHTSECELLCQDTAA